MTMDANQTEDYFSQSSKLKK